MLHSNYIQILLNLKDVSIINFSDSSVTIQLPRKQDIQMDLQKEKTIR